MSAVVFAYPEDALALAAYRVANPSVRFIHDTAAGVMRELVAQPLVPAKISRRQAWLELHAREQLDAAKSLAESEGGAMAIYFFESTEYVRSHPQTAAAFTLFGMDAAEADAFFIAAAAR